MTSLYSSVSGLYRGICVSNVDPDGLGRIRVQVPQILGAYASGWAFPAWSFHDLTIWPEDRLPKPGDGVWIMFEASSPDKMIWVAAFGPHEHNPLKVPEQVFATTLTIVAPGGTPAYNDLVTFSGVLGSDNGVPGPKPVVELWAQPVGSDWRRIGSAFADPVTGDWSVDYAINLPGAVNYTAWFDKDDDNPNWAAYHPAQSEVVQIDTETPVVITTPSVASSLYHGQSFLLSGQITMEETGDPVSVGSLSLEYRYTDGPDTTTWYTDTTTGLVTSLIDGQYQINHPGWDTTLGPVELRVVYSGGVNYDDVTSTGVLRTIHLPANSPLVKEAKDHDHIAFSWSAVSGATAYHVELSLDGGAFSEIPDSPMAETSLSASLSQLMTNYTFRVRPAAVDITTATVFGAYSETLTLFTGQPEIRDSGTSAYIYVTASNMRSWREQDADQPNKTWQGYTRQGRPDDGKVYHYYGLCSYSANQIRDAVRSGCGGGTTGTNRQTNGTCAEAAIEMTRRDDVGDTSEKKTVKVWVTDQGAGAIGAYQESAPAVHGTAVTTESTNALGRKWYNVGTTNGQRLGDGTDRSVLIKNNGTNNYIAFSPDGARLRIKWTWNYASQVYVAADWVT